jgi:hypothetical protein
MQIQTNTLTVGALLSNGRIYQLPQFQRSYRWSEEQAYQLFEDLQNAFIETNANHGIEYFLGAIILVDGVYNQPYEVVDGQQRLITILTILAMLRDRLDQGDYRRSLQEFIERPENLTLGHDRSARLRMKEQDHDGFEHFIIVDGGTTSDPQNLTTASLRNLRNVVRRLTDEFSNANERFYEGFVSFILTRCSVVVISTNSLESAYKLFKSVNSKGTPLDELSLARAELVGPVVNDPRVSWALTEKWDELVESMNEDELKGYVRTIARIANPHEKENDLYIQIRHISLNRNLANIFQRNLASFVNNYSLLRSCSINFGQDSNMINRHIHNLSCYPVTEWRSVALTWLAKPRSNQAHLEFFRKLDGLVLGLIVLHSKQSNSITKRFGLLISAINQDNILTAASSPLILDSNERFRIRQRMGEPSKSLAKHLLFRLNAAFASEEIKTLPSRALEVEHILPQTLPDGSDWLNVFDRDSHATFVNRLGNLTLLTRKINASIKNSPFRIKVNRICELEGNNCFPITNNLKNYNQWDQSAIISREESLVAQAYLIMGV